MVWLMVACPARQQNLASVPTSTTRRNCHYAAFKGATHSALANRAMACESAIVNPRSGGRGNGGRTHSTLCGKRARIRLSARASMTPSTNTSDRGNSATSLRRASGVDLQSKKT
eukprot:scaffold37730_cov28-Tisochrysis_lutea.AAC.1